MVGCVGLVLVGLGFMLIGIFIFVCFIIYKVVESFGGEFIEFNIEVVIMVIVIIFV